MLKDKTNSKYIRYIRQISIDEIGVNGQNRLFKAKVLVVGAGGLGSTVASYLAAAGVGKIGIVDGDVVEVHNLQRQIVHAGNVGLNKAESLKSFINRLNPDVDVKAYPFHLTEDNAGSLIKKYDIVISCPDNIETRFLINRICVEQRKPMIHGAVNSFEGEVSIFHITPCYQCIYGSITNYNNVSQETLGFTTCITGCLQGIETIKLILGLPVLKGEILRFDLKNMNFTKIRVKSNPKCKVCGKFNLPRGINDY